MIQLGSQLFYIVLVCLFIITFVTVFLSALRRMSDKTTITKKDEPLTRGSSERKEDDDTAYI